MNAVKTGAAGIALLTVLMGLALPAGAAPGRSDPNERREERRERVEDRREDRRERIGDRREDRRDRADGRQYDRHNGGRGDWHGRDHDLGRDRDWNRHDRDWNREDRNDRGRGWRHDDRRRVIVVTPGPNYRYRPRYWGGAPFRWDNRYSNYDYSRYYRPGYGYYGPVGEDGWRTVYSWLRDEPAGRHWVMWQFDNNRNGRLDRREALRANRAFQRLADGNRDGRLSRGEINYAVTELRNEYRYAFRR